MRSFLVLTIVCLTCSAVWADTPAGLVVHEWGTFTSLQNERGEAIGGINTDDEPVPAFVHSFDSRLVSGPPQRDQFGLKGVFQLPHPDITMRLETPVVYFYRPAGSAQMKLDLSVTFHGGYLSQYYPNVTGSPPVTQDLKTGAYKAVTEQTMHTITWPNLQIGTDGVGPKTVDRVWTAPREVKADNVTSEKGESEKFLFYRGVGHLDSPLQVLKDGSNLRLAGLPVLQPPMNRMFLKSAWLVDIRPDGTVAFQAFKALNAPAVPDGEVYGFTALADYSAENLSKLKSVMRDSLVAEGLFADEADAMLNTWEASYFKAPGLRVFYIVPKGWVEQVLPMKVSVPADITRVMVGRIELVSPQQRALLASMQKADEAKQLGRFAAALMNNEQLLHPSPRMASLIDSAGFQPAIIAR